MADSRNQRSHAVYGQLRSGFVGTIAGVGQTYRYRFLLDNERWENDWAAEAYTPNPFGTDDSVIGV